MLNLERLRVLSAVATTGSVVAAARSLHVTTSAVSQQVARLESEVDQPLVERHGRGVRLTEAGRRLSLAAAGLLAEVERVESDLAAHRGTVSGPVTVAAFATAARAFFPGVLSELRRAHPALTVRTREQEPHLSLPALARGDLDVAVVQDWPDAPLPLPVGVSRTHLVNDVFDLAVPAGSPLTAGVALEDLRDEAWVGWSEGQICHDWLVRGLWPDGGPTPLHTASEHATQLALVAAGAGVALIPRLGRDHAPPTVRFVPIEPPPTRRVSAVWRTSTTANPAVAAVLAALRTDQVAT